VRPCFTQLAVACATLKLRTETDVVNRTLSPAAFALLLAFGLTAYGGANLLGFQRLAHRTWLGPADQPLSSVLDSLSAWTNTSSVAMPARSLMLDIIMAETPHDHAAIEGALEEIAAASPTSTATWQALAEVRKARGASMESVLAAFRMSSLTGSHEGYFMMQRAIFGLKYWKELPEEDRQTVARDLLGSFGAASGAASRYHGILARKSQAERDEIKAALIASGLASKDVLQGLGV
jgi:hypothetical protein